MEEIGGDHSLFEVRIPIESKEFLDRVKAKVRELNPNDSNRFFSTSTTIDFGSIDLYKDKIIVWKLRKPFNQPSNVGTGKIEMTFKDTIEGTFLYGKVTANTLPKWGAIAIMIFFGILGLSIGIPSGPVTTIKATLLTLTMGGVIVLINVLMKREYYISVRAYGMNFIKEVMRNEHSK